MDMRSKERHTGKTFFIICTLAIAAILVFYFVWMIVPHRLIPAGAEDLKPGEVRYSVSPDGTDMTSGNVILGQKGYYLNDAGQEKLVEFLKTCEMRIYPGNRMTFYEEVPREKQFMINMFFTVNGKTTNKSIQTFNGIQVLFIERYMGFPGNLFLADSDYLAFISNYSVDEFYSELKALCEQYGTLSLN